MPAYRLSTISPEARQAALRALDAALEALLNQPAPATRLTPIQLIELSIIDDALDHLHAHKLPR